MPLLLSLFLLVQAPADTVDVLIRGGTVYDGSGGAARRVDMGIRGDRIVFIGNAAQARIGSKRTIDATGLIVAPGFIDPHTHSFDGLPTISEVAPQEPRRADAGRHHRRHRTPTVAARSMSPESSPRRRGWASAPIPTPWPDSARARSRVMGSSSAPATPAQIDYMKKLIDKAMSEGAFGVGSGLFYAPQILLHHRRSHRGRSKAPSRTAASTIPTSATKAPTPSGCSTRCGRPSASAARPA